MVEALRSAASQRRQPFICPRGFSAPEKRVGDSLCHYSSGACNTSRTTTVQAVKRWDGRLSAHSRAGENTVRGENVKSTQVGKAASRTRQGIIQTARSFTWRFIF